MRQLIITLLFLAPAALSAQIVCITCPEQRMVQTANSTGASVDTVYSKVTSTSLLAAIHKQSLYSKGGLNDGNFYYGVSAGLQWTTGIHNIAIGYETHRNNSTGSYNVMIGNGAGKAATGSGNMYIGPFQVGALQTSGSNNIMMRYNGNLSTTTVSNEMDIGAAIFGTGVNEVNGSNISAGKLGFFVRPLLGQVEHGGVSGLTSGMYYNTVIHPTINQSGTAGFSMIRVSPYLQATGSGEKFLMNLGTNSAAFGTGTHTSLFNISNRGDVWLGRLLAPSAVDSFPVLDSGRIKAVNLAEIRAAIVDTLQISTRAWRQKGIDSVAALITALPVFASGTYTPTITNGTNVGSSAVSGTFTYTRVGSVVTVAGHIAITPTAGTTITTLEFTLPVASAFTSFNQGAGSLVSPAPEPTGNITVNSTTDRAQVEITPANTSGRTYAVNFQYQVL